jgi:hypothetical protein
MSSSVPRLASLLLLSALVATAGAAAAQGRGHDRAQTAGGNGQERAGAAQVPQRSSHDRREDHRELSDAVRRVERRTGGQVLSAERVPFDGRDVNRVKVVDSSGRVRVYMDDPKPARGRSTPPREAASGNDD